MPLHYPFSAVVGSDDMALALLLNAVSPSVGGVLIRGEKGTAKSTMVRALAGILPQIEVVAGDSPLRLVRLHDTAFTDRLVDKFELPVQGWRGPSSR